MVTPGFLVAGALVLLTLPYWLPGIAGPELFSALVLVALVTTSMTSWLSWLDRRANRPAGSSPKPVPERAATS